MGNKLRSIIRDIILEIKEEEIEEITQTSAVAGYNTPNAFKKTDGRDEDAEPDGEYVDRLNKSTGYRRVNENRWLELKNSDGTPNQKLGKGIREIRYQLKEIENFVNWYSKIKNESGLESDAYWKRTQKHLNAIRERLHSLSKKMREL